MVHPFFDIALNDHHLWAELILSHNLLLCMIYYTLFLQLSMILPIWIPTFHNSLSYPYIKLDLLQQTPLFVVLDN